MGKLIHKEVNVGELDLIGSMHTSLEHFKKKVDELYEKYPDLKIEKEYSYPIDDFSNDKWLNSVYYYTEEEITEEEFQKMSDDDNKKRIEDINLQISDLENRREILLRSKK